MRLPTEAEWEYLCRAGTTTEFHWGDGLEPDRMNFIGGYESNSPGKRSIWQRTTAGCTFPANPWGLFDCHGNVWEWCQDWYDATYYRHSPAVDPEGPSQERKYRVCRGGSHLERFDRCRSARRNWYGSDRRLDTLGFRVVFA